MKKVISLYVVLFFLLSQFTASAVVPQKNAVASGSNVTKVEVYYFHYTRRCTTCQAVETESQKAIRELYPVQYKSGKITFRSVNLDENNSKAMAENCKAEGQALLIISGGKRIDLTEQGFMYAVSHPDKLKKELKKTIDSLF